MLPAINWPEACLLREAQRHMPPTLQEAAVCNKEAREILMQQKQAPWVQMASIRLRID